MLLQVSFGLGFATICLLIAPLSPSVDGTASEACITRPQLGRWSQKRTVVLLTCSRTAMCGARRRRIPLAASLESRNCPGGGSCICECAICSCSCGGSSGRRCASHAAAAMATSSTVFGDTNVRYCSSAVALHEVRVHVCLLEAVQCVAAPTAGMQCAARLTHVQHRSSPNYHAKQHVPHATYGMPLACVSRESSSSTHRVDFGAETGSNQTGTCAAAAVRQTSCGSAAGFCCILH